MNLVGLDFRGLINGIIYIFKKNPTWTISMSFRIIFEYKCSTTIKACFPSWTISTRYFLKTWQARQIVHCVFFIINSYGMSFQIPFAWKWSTIIWTLGTFHSWTITTCHFNFIFLQNMAKNNALCLFHHEQLRYVFSNQVCMEMKH